MTTAATRDQAWRAGVERAIGARLETLLTRSADGMPIQPLYERREDDAPRPWRATRAWSVAQRIDHPDAETANRLALLDLEGGADALTLVYAASSFARGFGLDADTDLELALDGIELDLVSLRLDAGGDTITALRALAALVERRTLTSAALAIDVGFDPIGLRAGTGVAPDADALKDVLHLADKAGLSGRPLLADSRPYHEAGAGEAQELAALVATGIAYLRRLEAVGLALDKARDLLAFLLAVDADLFLGLAKVRAVRRLWARVEAACGLEPKPIRLHVETSWRMMTRRDPWTNVMRATAATFAAGLGGADVITVLPLTLPRGLPDEPARRVARNVQRVLIDEARLAVVDDPAAGAGGFEALTDGLCETAWSLFQEIERDGGIERALDGSLPDAIARQAAGRRIEIETMGRGIVGTSLFPTLDAPELGVLDVAPTSRGRTNGLPAQRDAEPFEALRDRAESDPSLARPSVFLATLGAPAAFGPSAAYAVNVFAAAGLHAEAPVDTRDGDALLAAFGASGTPVACLCGTDDAYVDAAALAKRLRGAGARRILLSGAPGSRHGDLHNSGIDAFIHPGCAALAILQDTLETILERKRSA